MIEPAKVAGNNVARLAVWIGPPVEA